MNQDTVQLASLLFEIGTEDIPARFLPPAVRQLKENSELIFRENHIGFSSVKTYGSPRRLAMIADGIPHLQEDRTKEVFGPSKKAAFDENGNPTKAAIGFANSQGVGVESLILRKKNNGEYVVAVKEEKGVRVMELLPDILNRIVLSLHFPKAMRWGGNNMKFVRPVRWLLAIFDKEVVNFEIEAVKSGGMTRGHRFLSPAAFQLKDCQGYTKLLANNYVIVDEEERKRIITSGIEKLSASVSGKPVKDDALIMTVANIVEYPVPVLGSFSAEYLKLPRELLVTVMKEHQKYFAIENGEGRLTNNFIIISNTSEENAETVRVGAERVIRARFEDARFYFEEDRKKSLEHRIDELKAVTYQEKLGSLYDKVLRVKSIAGHIASKVNPSLREKAERAALLSKTDLITGVVREFPELQGIMGRYYAINDAEDVEVADALLEQYYHGDRVPETDAGAILGLSDKIDNIVSFFSIGLIPTGSEDPFALRRQALGAIAILLTKGYGLSLGEMIDEALKNAKRKDGIKESVLQFFEQRFDPLFAGQGYGFNDIQSVLYLSADTPLREIKGRLDAIREFRNDGIYNDFITAVKRLKNIIPKADLPQVNPALLSSEPEKRLYERSNALKVELENLLGERRYVDALRTFSSLTSAVNDFFDNVLVMDKQEDIRLNRLALLKSIWATALSLADFSKL